MTDPDAVILSVNPAFTRITGYSAPEVVGQKTSLLRSHHHGADYFRELWQGLTRNGYWEGEIWNRHKNGSLYLERLTINAVKSDTGDVTHYVGVFNDITESRRKDEWIRHMAYHDALTALPNRMLFENRLRYAVSVATRENRKFVVLFIDLDQFKHINDSLGHNVGDLLLQNVANRLRNLLRRADTLARLGGDEFVVLTTSASIPEDSAVLAQKIIDALSRPFTVLSHSIHVGASLGIAVFPDDGCDITDLMKNADAAMYAAKNAGRGVYRFFQPSMSERAAFRLELELRLRRAIKNQELSLHYQPQIDARTKKADRFEALLRWYDNHKQVASPAEFIPVSEDSGLIGDIGKWVFWEACRQIAEWRDKGFGPIRVTVNVSAKQLLAGQLIADIATAAGHYGIPTSGLEVELTESVVMARPEEAVEIFHALHNIGVSIAVDDFGTGYSSLAYLRRLPIDVLKIDRSFIADADVDPDDLEIVRTIVALGKTLKLTMVAEGVETEKQAELLEVAGCDLLQGYLYSKPLPAAELQQRWLPPGVPSTPRQ